MAEAAPKNGEYLEGKLWFARRGSLLTIGLTSAAIDQVGDVEGVEFPDEGDDFDKGDVALTIEGTKGSFEVTVPAAGTVNELNEVVSASPEVISEDPLEEGWLLKMEIQDPSDLTEFSEDASDDEE